MCIAHASPTILILDTLSQISTLASSQWPPPETSGLHLKIDAHPHALGWSINFKYERLIKPKLYLNFTAIIGSSSYLLDSQRYQFSSLITPWEITSRIKWILTSTRLVHSWNVFFSHMYGTMTHNTQYIMRYTFEHSSTLSVFSIIIT